MPWMNERPMPCAVRGRLIRKYYARSWDGPLRDARHEFGAAIAAPEKYLCGRRIPATLTKVGLHFWTPCIMAEEDQAIPRPNLILPAQRDPCQKGCASSPHSSRSSTCAL